MSSWLLYKLDGRKQTKLSELLAFYSKTIAHQTFYWLSANQLSLKIFFPILLLITVSLKDKISCAQPPI